MNGSHLDAEMREAIKEAAREGCREVLHETFLRLGVDLDKPESVDERYTDMRWARRMRLLSEKGRMIFWTVTLTAVCIWIVTSIWQGFGKAVKTVIPALAVVLIGASLMGCAPAYPEYPKAPSYWPSIEDWNRRYCMERGGEWKPLERRCDGAVK